MPKRRKKAPARPAKKAARKKAPSRPAKKAARKKAPARPAKKAPRKKAPAKTAKKTARKKAPTAAAARAHPAYGVTGAERAVWRDSRAIAKALGRWSGIPGEPETWWQREPTDALEGSAVSQVTSPRGVKLREGGIGGKPAMPPNKAGNLAAVRVQISIDSSDGDSDARERIWVPVAALTARWDQMAGDIHDELAVIADAYEAEAIHGWSAYVCPPTIAKDQTGYPHKKIPGPRRARRSR